MGDRGRWRGGDTASAEIADHETDPPGGAAAWKTTRGLSVARGLMEGEAAGDCREGGREWDGGVDCGSCSGCCGCGSCGCCGAGSCGWGLAWETADQTMHPSVSPRGLGELAPALPRRAMLEDDEGATMLLLLLRATGVFERADMAGCAWAAGWSTGEEDLTCTEPEGVVSARARRYSSCVALVLGFSLVASTVNEPALPMSTAATAADEPTAVPTEPPALPP